jgi:hypothetical protein
MKKLLNFTPNFFQILVKFRTRKKEFQIFLWIFCQRNENFLSENITGNATHSFNTKSMFKEVGRVDRKEHVADVLVNLLKLSKQTPLLQCFE